jgi:phosphatidylinositol-3-phosphatase
VTPTAERPPAASGPCGARAASVYRHVIWIWMENRAYSDVMATGQAPRLASYTRRCGLATDYDAIAHPSLPNYLAAVEGTTAGVSTDCDPSSCPQPGSSLFGQVAAAGEQWRGYAEAMSAPCDGASYDSYAARHNPAVYFTAIRARCRAWDVPMGGVSGPFAAALADRGLPAFAFVTPDLCDDGHDCSTASADTWLGGWLDRITSSPAYRAADTVVFVTWDEGVGSDQRVVTVVIAPTVPPGTASAQHFTHYSLLRTTEELLHLPLLGDAAQATSMAPAFHLAP